MNEVAVIGCGVIGLTSALEVQKRLKNTNVTIFTKDVSPNTTGDVAAGLWIPYLLANTPADKVSCWCKATSDYALKLWKQGKAKEAGVCLQPIIYLSVRENYKIPDWVNITLGYAELSRDHLARLSKQYKTNFTGGFLFTSFTWEASYFLPFLQQEFVKNGGRIIMKEIKDFGELTDYDVIVNCTGLQSRELTGDSKVKPIRGQIIRVEAPWQLHSYILDSDESRYVVPNINCVILGGTNQPSYNLEIDETDKQDIMRKCSQLVPASAAAKIIKHQVGLRPGRDKVRLEIEIKGSEKNGVKIVHNYGHGGSGITLSIGCAQEAAELVGQIVNHKNLLVNCK